MCQPVTTIFFTSVIFLTQLTIVAVSTEEGYVNQTRSSEFLSLKQDSLEGYSRPNISRSRRNTYSIGSNVLGGSLEGPIGPGNNIEGLLASCQMTNLLLSQILQQRTIIPQQNGNVVAANNLHPFLAVGGILNDFIHQPRLTTYITTSTSVSQITSTVVLTIPLLFGNKPSPTTITRTKIHEVTISDVQTITTTVEPSKPETKEVVLSTTAITPTPSFVVFSTAMVLQVPENVDPNNDIAHFQDQPVEPRSYSTPVVSFDKSILEKVTIHAEASKEKNYHPKPRKYTPMNKIFGARNDEEKILRVYPAATTENYLHYMKDRTPAFPYGPEIFNRKRFLQSPPISSYENERARQDKIHTFSSEDGVSQNYFARRLKRRDETDEEGVLSIRDREHFLEPSLDGDSSSHQFDIQAPKCPTPLEITITKTITKFVNPSASIMLPNHPKSPQGQHEQVNEDRPRVGRKFERRTQPEVDQRMRSYEIVKEFNPTTPAAPALRTRKRGDILHRERVSSEDSARFNINESSGIFDTEVKSPRRRRPLA